MLAAGGGGNFGVGFEGPFSSNDPSHFVTGTNVLEVEVNNAAGPDPNPVALVLRGAVRFAPAPPQVPSLPPLAALLILPALLGAAWPYLAGRRRRRATFSQPHS